MTRITIDLKDIKRFTSLDIKQRDIDDTLADAKCGHPILAEHKFGDMQVIIASSKDQLQMDELIDIINTNTHIIIFQGRSYFVYKISVIDGEICWESEDGTSMSKYVHAFALVVLFNRYYIIPEMLLQNEMDKAISKIESAQ